VTIALGFKCNDGVVLCSDSQITKEGDLKFNESKLRLVAYQGDSGNWAIGVTYAGSPEFMKLFMEKFTPSVWAIHPKPNPSAIRSAIETILDGIYRQHRSLMNLELLCAISIPPHLDELIVSRNKLVRDAQVECLGVGDTSVVRYLSNLFISYNLYWKQALQIAVYIVQQAKKYTDRCGGPTEAFVIRNGGIYPHGDLVTQRLEKYFDLAEVEMKRLVESFVDPSLSNTEFSAIASQIAVGLSAIRAAPETID
jgi:hypothetical protein